MADTTITKALSHPLRRSILNEYAARPDGRLSPIEVADLVSNGDGPQLSLVSYHVRQLHAAGLLTPAGQEPRRGAVEHYYRLAPAARRQLPISPEEAARCTCGPWATAPGRRRATTPSSPLSGGRW
jgi:DNA-binding transcriptional ArsR family regulator